MGTLGAEAFANDDALDWLLELDPADGVRPVLAALERAAGAIDPHLDAHTAAVALAAAELLAAQGVSAEVVDLRTLRPIDLDTVLASVVKTNRIAVVEEGPLTGGWAGEVLALATEEALGDLDDAWRIPPGNTPIPYSPPLEDAFLPGPERIASEVLARP